MMFRVSEEAWAALDKALVQAGDDKQARKAVWEAWNPYREAWEDQEERETMTNAKTLIPIGQLCRYCDRPATQVVRTRVGFSWEPERFVVMYLCERGIHKAAAREETGR